MMAAVAGEHEIRVGLGAAVFAIIEIEHRHALARLFGDDAAGDGGDLGRHRHLVDLALLHQPLERLVQRHPGAGDGGGAGAAIGLEHVAIDP